MYYKFYPDAVKTETGFMHAIDALSREIGDRGKPKTLAEGVPPPAPAPAPAAPTSAAAAPAPALTVALDPATTPLQATSQSYSPSMQQSMQPSSSDHRGGAGSSGASLMEVSAFMKEQLDESRQEREAWQARLEKEVLKREQAQQETERQRQEMQAKMELQRVAAEQQRQQQRQQVEEMKTQAVEGKLMEHQLAALQTRLQALHATKLLSDEELYRCEDILADSVEVDLAPGEGSAQVARMVALSERLTVDATLARQLRRRFG